MDLWLKRRTRSQYILLAQFFVLGVEYTIINPTLIFYLKEFHVANVPFYFGVVQGSFWLSSIIFSLVMGRLADVTLEFRKIVLALNFLSALGNLLYTVGYSPYLLLLARFLCGSGDALMAVTYGECGRCFTRDEVQSKTGRLMVGCCMGMCVGPIFNMMPRSTYINLGLLSIRYTNAPGVFLFLSYCVMFVISFWGIFNLSKEKKRLEELHFVTTSNNDLHKNVEDNANINDILRGEVLSNIQNGNVQLTLGKSSLSEKDALLGGNVSFVGKKYRTGHRSNIDKEIELLITRAENDTGNYEIVRERMNEVTVTEFRSDCDEAKKLDNSKAVLVNSEGCLLVNDYAILTDRENVERTGAPPTTVAQFQQDSTSISGVCTTVSKESKISEEAPLDYSTTNGICKSLEDSREGFKKGKKHIHADEKWYQVTYKLLRRPDILALFCSQTIWTFTSLTLDLMIPLVGILMLNFSSRIVALCYLANSIVMSITLISSDPIFRRFSAATVSISSILWILFSAMFLAMTYLTVDVNKALSITFYAIYFPTSYVGWAFGTIALKSTMSHRAELQNQSFCQGMFNSAAYVVTLIGVLTVGVAFNHFMQYCAIAITLTLIAVISLCMYYDILKIPYETTPEIS